MAWIYLAESEDSPEHWKDIQRQLPTVKMTAIAKGFYLAEWEISNYPQPQSGPTLELLTPLCSPAESTSSTADSLAKTFQLPAAEKAWAASVAAFSSRSSGSLAKYDRDSSSWRTYQLLIDGAEILSSELWPTSGMTVAGTCYPLQMWERITSGNDGGYWPTPDSSPRGTRSLDLIDGRSAVRRKSGQRRGIDLQTAAKMWPTPRASEWKGCGPKGSRSQKYRLEKGYLDATVSEREAQAGGQLNPTWVEWLMGYPSGWTVLEDWAIAWSRPKRGKHLSV